LWCKFINIIFINIIRPYRQRECGNGIGQNAVSVSLGISAAAGAVESHIGLVTAGARHGAVCGFNAVGKIGREIKESIGLPLQVKAR